MLIKKVPGIPWSEVTPERLYLKRRDFIRASSGAAIGALGALAGAHAAGPVLDDSRRGSLR